MKRYMRAWLVCAVWLLGTVAVFGQKDQNWAIINSALKGLEYEVKAGLLIGGTTPLPLPAEIRNITSYNPTLLIAIEGNITKWFDKEKKWGMTIGLRLDNKGHFSVGADADITVFDLDTQKPVATYVKGKTVYKDGHVYGANGTVICTQYGEQAVKDRGINTIVVDPGKPVADRFIV